MHKHSSEITCIKFPRSVLRTLLQNSQRKTFPVQQGIANGASHY